MGHELEPDETQTQSLPGCTVAHFWPLSASFSSTTIKWNSLMPGFTWIILTPIFEVAQVLIVLVARHILSHFRFSEVCNTLAVVGARWVLVWTSWTTVV